MIKKLCPIIGSLLIIGTANDIATFPQIAISVGVGSLLIGAGIYFMAKDYEKEIKYFRLRFISPNGEFRTIKAKSYAGRNKAIKDLTKKGYVLYSEAEIKEDIA